MTITELGQYIPSNEPYVPFDVDALVHLPSPSEGDGRIRLDITANGTTYLTAAETQQLIGLLLTAMAEGRSK